MLTTARPPPAPETPTKRLLSSRLLPRVVEEREAKNAEREAEAPKLQALLEDYLAEVQADSAPSSATVQALRSFRVERRPEPEEMRARHDQLLEELTTILDQAQLETIHSFRPMEAAGPTEEERAERREERREQRADKLQRRSEGLDPEDVEAMEQMHHQQGARRHGKRVARDILFSPAVLDALSR